MLMVNNWFLNVWQEYVGIFKADCRMSELTFFKLQCSMSRIKLICWAVYVWLKNFQKLTLYERLNILEGYMSKYFAGIAHNCQLK